MFWFTAFLSALGILVAPVFAFAAVSNVTSGLSLGSSGQAVTALQGFLAADSSVYPEGLITGYFGFLTEKAVQRYQCNKGIVCSGAAMTTGYGRVGPVTLAAIQGSAMPGFDVNAPMMSVETVSTTTPNSVLINWTTSEAARSRVMFGTSYPFLYASAPYGSDPVYDTTSSVVISGLASSTTYYYVRESVDANSNVMWTTAKTFRTQ